MERQSSDRRGEDATGRQSDGRADLQRLGMVRAGARSWPRRPRPPRRSANGRVGRARDPRVEPSGNDAAGDPGEFCPVSRPVPAPRSTTTSACADTRRRGRAPPRITGDEGSAGYAGGRTRTRGARAGLPRKTKVEVGISKILIRFKGRESRDPRREPARAGCQRWYAVLGTALAVGDAVVTRFVL